MSRLSHVIQKRPVAIQEAEKEKLKHHVWQQSENLGDVSSIQNKDHFLFSVLRVNILVTHHYILEASLEAKVPTIWTDGKAQPGRSSHREKVRREKLREGEDQRWRKSEERCRRVKR